LNSAIIKFEKQNILSANDLIENLDSVEYHKFQRIINGFPNNRIYFKSLLFEVSKKKPEFLIKYMEENPNEKDRIFEEARLSANRKEIFKVIRYLE
jgi:hypothetical protein